MAKIEAYLRDILRVLKDILKEPKRLKGLN